MGGIIYLLEKIKGIFLIVRNRLLRGDSFYWKNIANTLPNSIYTKNLEGEYTWINDVSRQEVKNKHGVDSSYQGAYKGLGLGLYVVKKYVDAMKGEISVESKVGEGTCFTLSIPLTIEKEGKTEPLNVTEKAVKKISKKNEGPDSGAISSQPVLLVEDDKIAAMAVRMNLTKLGCQVDWVESGEDALEKAKNTNCSIIFMDIGLPKKTGVETASEIRGFMDKEKASTPIVALTGHARGKIRQLCLNVGMQNVLSKPADFVDLKKALNYFSRK